MARFWRGGARRSPSRRRSVRGYTIRGKYGRVNYVGVTNNPTRRASEHSRAGKRGAMKVETRAMSRESARRWESRKLGVYRRNHAGKNPRFNRTRSGGWLR